MTTGKRTVLITGCSEGGLGDALARELHQRGHRVFATARNPAKMAKLAGAGIETLVLDVLDAESIAACVRELSERTGGTLDMLINNSGGGYSMPLLDIDYAQARATFELNFWSVLAVIQAFTPLLIKSTHNPTIVNNTSGLSVVPYPLSGIYNTSKAALAMLSDTLRLELEPFGVQVVDLKTGGVRSNFFANQEGGHHPTLPEGSLYSVARAEVEHIMSGGTQEPGKMDSAEWARRVVSDITRASPPIRSWRGKNGTMAWLATMIPWSWYVGNLLKEGAMDVVKRNWQARGRDKARG